MGPIAATAPTAAAGAPERRVARSAGGGASRGQEAGHQDAAETVQHASVPGLQLRRTRRGGSRAAGATALSNQDSLQGLHASAGGAQRKRSAREMEGKEAAGGESKHNRSARKVEGKESAGDGTKRKRSAREVAAAGGGAGNKRKRSNGEVAPAGGAGGGKRKRLTHTGRVSTVDEGLPKAQHTHSGAKRTRGSGAGAPAGSQGNREAGAAAGAPITPASAGGAAAGADVESRAGGAHCGACGTHGPGPMAVRGRRYHRVEKLLADGEAALSTQSKGRKGHGKLKGQSEVGAVAGLHTGQAARGAGGQGRAGGGASGRKRLWAESLGK